MSDGLRAEDVKEALELADNFYDGTDYNFDRLTPDEQETVVAAARAWLASQEQTPDIVIRRGENGEWPESVTSGIHLYDAQGRELSGVMILDYVEHALAALGGFHPQPEDSGPRQTPSALLRQLGIDDPVQSPEVPT